MTIRSLFRTALALTACAGPIAPVVAQTVAPTEHTREQWQRVNDVIAALGVGPGSHVADVGAGSGFYTVRLSQAVGEAGRVYAVDVNPVMVRELQGRIADLKAHNIEVLLGAEDDPKLPEGRLDAVLIVNAYHEMAEYRSMLGHIFRALEPGGTLALLEPGAVRPDDSREQMARRHQFAIGMAERDVTEAGFEVVRRDTAFATMPPHNHEGGGNVEPPAYWLLVVRRP